MPYVTHDERVRLMIDYPQFFTKRLDTTVELEVSLLAVMERMTGQETAGNIVYALTWQVNCFLACEPSGLNFAAISAAAGAIEGANERSLIPHRALLRLTWSEFYRRVAAPYEDGKLASNGDVFTVQPKETTNGKAPEYDRCGVPAAPAQRRSDRGLVARWFSLA